MGRIREWAGVIALFLVLAGGGAVAAFDPIGGDGDVDACFERKTGDLDLLKGKKCGRGEKSVAWSQSGPQGPPGEPGAQGEPGLQGQPGAPGPAGTARAYGRVDSAGTLSRAKNATVTKSTAPGAGNGVYCIEPTTGVDTATAILILTIDSADSDSGAAAEWDSEDTSFCPAGTLTALTRNPAGALANEAFSFAIP